jgi:hypothetical protein
MTTYYSNNDNDNDNNPIDINYNVIMDNNNSINSNETIILQDEFFIKIFHQPYQVTTIKQSQTENIINENENLNLTLKKSIIISILCCLIVLCIVFL